MGEWSTYDEYLMSETWKHKRNARLMYDGYQCKICGTAINLRVHHICYPSEWGTEPLTYLITVCDRCHDLLHSMEKSAEERREYMREEAEAKRHGVYLLRKAYRLADSIVGDETIMSLDKAQVKYAIKAGLCFWGFTRGDTDEKICSLYRLSPAYVKKNRAKWRKSMRQIKWDEITATSEGTYNELPMGPYIARIVSMTDDPAHEKVDLVFDIAEGEHAGHFSDAWGVEHPYAHMITLSYKTSALRPLKGKLTAIQNSNPGFDAFSAWDAGRLDMFTNRLFGINLRKEEYEKDGEKKLRNDKFSPVCSVKAIRDGKVNPLPPRTSNGSGDSAPAGTSQMSAADKAYAMNVEIPFA